MYALTYFFLHPTQIFFQNFVKNSSSELKAGYRFPRKLFFFDESQLKMVKKLFSYLRHFNVCPEFFGHVGNALIRKLRLISNLMASSTGKQLITILTSPIISKINLRCKDNQTMKFGQLIEHNKKDIVSKNHAKNDVKRLVPDLFCFFKKALFE